jgi:hypothetical protein
LNKKQPQEGGRNSREYLAQITIYNWMRNNNRRKKDTTGGGRMPREDFVSISNKN